ncbi:MAG: FkbM family methyltransferase [Gemmatimonadota bacterium]
MELDQTFTYLYKTYFSEDAKEREEIEQLPSFLEGCDLFIDIGASLGQYTYYANRIMSGGRIIAVEADPDRYAELARNCAKWQVEGTNSIKVIHAAAGDAHGKVQFYVTGTQISGGLFPVAERSDAYRPVEVQQVMVDDFHEPGVSTFVKIDVEGGEHRVLRGATAHITGGTTSFLTEVTWWGDRERGDTTLDLLRYLMSQHLHIRKVAKRRTSGYLLTPAPPSAAVWPDYLRAAPLLVATSLWGRLVPARLRLLRERRLNRRRLRRFADSPR